MGSKEEEVYWRDKKISDRMGFALENDKLYKDIDFIVGKNEIKMSAHKLILRLSSLVFENLITSHEEQGLAEIKLPNTPPDMFQRLLKFIYTDEMVMDELLLFLEVARDFGFQKLTEQSVRVLKKTEINEHNAVMIFDIAKGLGDHELEQASLSCIFKNAKAVLRSDSFPKISYCGLCQLLLDDRLETEELYIFHAVMRWADNQCVKLKIDKTPENLRLVLKEARLYIRYTQLGYDQVLSEVKPTGILSTSEFLQVLKYYADPTTANLLGLSTKQRKLKSNPQKHNSGSKRTTSVSAKKQKSSHSRISDPSNEDERNQEFRMQSTSMDFRDLLNTIQLRFTITRVILQNVFIANTECYQGRRVHLPNLKLFYYFIEKDNSDAKTILPDKSFMRGLSTKDFLFFEKDRLIPWAFDDLWDLGVDIVVQVKGLRLIDINHRDQELTLSYPVAEEAGQILNSLKTETKLKSLCLTTSSVTDSEGSWILINNPDTFIPSIDHLTTLVLQGVEFKNSVTATDFLSQFTNLKNLSVFIINAIAINFQHDLLKSRNSLQTMCLSKVNFGTFKKRKHIVPFVNCEKLYLDVCSWPHALADHFSVVFPKLKKLAIRSKGNCRCSARFFTEILEIRSIKRISLNKYPGTDDKCLANPILNMLLPPTGVNKTSVKNFLSQAGLEFSNSGCEVPDFVIDKDPDSGQWSVVHDCETELEDIHFQYSMLDNFFDDKNCSKSAIQ